MNMSVASLFFFVFFLLFSSLNVTFVAAGDLKNKNNPLTPKAYLTRYWNKKINNNLPADSESQFLLSKASPLKAADVASFAKLVTAQNCPSSLLPGGSMFNIYGPYEDYAKNDINFINYGSNSSESETEPAVPPQAGEATNSLVTKKKVVNYNRVEPGTFFRESMLKPGTVMPMPDIKDKMPKRSFLRRAVVSKLPFSSSKLTAMKETFNASDNPAMERIIKEALKDCERKPNQGEKKRCVGSAEDMIDFATSVLGRDVTVRKTKNSNGAKQNITIGSIKGINGGRKTKPVSCHQKLYPYLLYYCHSVPKVRVYEADILDPKTKKKINHGVAICHIDTSSWSTGHKAFLVLGSGPGQIEVCHWIFQNDLLWTVADH